MWALPWNLCHGKGFLQSYGLGTHLKPRECRSHDWLDSREVPIKTWEREWQPEPDIVDVYRISSWPRVTGIFIWTLLIFCALKLAARPVIGKPRTEELQRSHPSRTFRRWWNIYVPYYEAELHLLEKQARTAGSIISCYYFTKHGG